MAIGTAFERSYSFQQSLAKCARIPRAYLQQSVALIQTCRSLVESSEFHRMHPSEEIEHIVKATTAAINAALQPSSECDTKFLLAKAAIMEILGKMGANNDTGVSTASFENMMKGAKDKDGNANVKLIGVKEKILHWKKKKAESTSQTKQVTIAFSRLQGPLGPRKTTPVCIDQVPNVGEVILWMYNSLAGADHQIALNQNPHFYLDLSTDPKSYNNNFTHQAIDWDNLPPIDKNSEYDVSILVDRKCHIFIENGTSSRTFGNIWKVAQTSIILKDISGSIMSSEIVKQSLTNQPLEISARTADPAVAIVRNNARRIKGVDSLFEQALQDDKDWLIRIPSDGGISQQQVAERWVQVFPQPLILRTDTETLTEDDAEELFHTPMSAFTDSGYSSDAIIGADSHQDSTVPALSSVSHTQTPRGSASGFSIAGQTTSHESWSSTSHRQTTSLGKPSQPTLSSITRAHPQPHRQSVSGVSTAGSSTSHRSQSTIYYQQASQPQSPGQSPQPPSSNGAKITQVPHAAPHRSASNVSTQSTTSQQTPPLQPSTSRGMKQTQTPTPTGASSVSTAGPSVNRRLQSTASHSQPPPHSSLPSQPMPSDGAKPTPAPHVAPPQGASGVPLAGPSASRRPQPTTSHPQIPSASNLMQSSCPLLSDGSDGAKPTEATQQRPITRPAASHRPQQTTSHPPPPPQPSISQTQTPSPDTSPPPPAPTPQQTSSSGWWGWQPIKALYHRVAG